MNGDDVLSLQKGRQFTRLMSGNPEQLLAIPEQ
jgi:hypothetical protein